MGGISSGIVGVFLKEMDWGVVSVVVTVLYGMFALHIVDLLACLQREGASIILLVWNSGVRLVNVVLFLQL